MRIFLFVVVLAIQSTSGLAKESQMVGPVQPKPSKTEALAFNAKVSHSEDVTLLKVVLSEKDRQTLRHRLNNVLRKKGQPIASLNMPYMKQLGMNDVPVFQQGIHGSCATFATTAAIDAALGKGDYVSQLCLLQLGKYLEGRSFAYSGWEGEHRLDVLYKLSMYGVMTTEQQATLSCGGETSYPAYSQEPKGVMDLDDYYLHSQSLKSLGIRWSYLFDDYQVFDKSSNFEEALRTIKRILSQGDRVVFSALLADLDHGTAGASAKFHAKDDSWALTKEVIEAVHSSKTLDQFGLHAMVITGYDDLAIAVDKEGQFHRGLLTLRSSWGTKKGDQGDFYMSYDYFKVFRRFAVQIRKDPEV